jgi:hypothetical protein
MQSGLEEFNQPEHACGIKRWRKSKKIRFPNVGGTTVAYKA